GVRYTQQNQEHIRQPKAWMRRTAYNIIRECKRDRQRYSAVAFNELMEQAPLRETSSAEVDDRVIAQSIASVLQAFDALSPGELNLIQWKVLEGLSWGEVQSRLIAEGEEQVSLATLHTWGQRALEKLQQAYFAISNQLFGSSELALESINDPSSYPNEYQSHLEIQTRTAFLGRLGRSIQETSQLDNTFGNDISSAPSNKSNVSWEITLEGKLSGTSADYQLIEAVVTQLKWQSGDDSLTLIRFRDGSIVIELDGSAEGYKIIEFLIMSGQLTNVLGLKVKKVELVNDFSDKEKGVPSIQEYIFTKHENYTPCAVPKERSEIYGFLSNLPSHQLSEVVFHINPPRGNLPRSDASTGERVAALLDWVESPIGPGIETLIDLLKTVLNRR
ncbi:sigma-70 family RNA polymerase sigma factor, partial [Phormidium sp. FACHB-322]